MLAAVEVSNALNWPAVFNVPATPIRTLSSTGPTEPAVWLAKHNVCPGNTPDGLSVMLFAARVLAPLLTVALKV